MFTAHNKLVYTNWHRDVKGHTFSGTVVYRWNTNTKTISGSINMLDKIPEHDRQNNVSSPDKFMGKYSSIFV